MRVTLRDGSEVRCDDEPFAEGGQAEVHETQDGSAVIKLYDQLPKNPDRWMKRLRYIIEDYNLTESNPHLGDVLCWPDGIVTEPRLGVRMPKLPDEMDELKTLFNRTTWDRNLPWADIEDDLRWGRRVLLALNLARGMRYLHKNGLVYCDLSPYNVFSNLETGKVTLIDLDGLSIPAEDLFKPVVLGTPEYNAPEIVEDRVDCSRETDRHDLAVIIHRLLLFHHPLIGSRSQDRDEASDEEQYEYDFGRDALYIYHPDDSSNRPDGEYLYPPKLLGDDFRDLFHRVFIDGIRNPSARPTASEWEQALVRLLDRIMTCPDGCTVGSFPLARKGTDQCFWCGSRVPMQDGRPFLFFYQKRGSGASAKWSSEEDLYVVGANGRPIHRWHAYFGETADWDNTKPVARILRESSAWYLENIDLPGMQEIRDTDDLSGVPIGDRVELTDDTQILLDDPDDGGRRVLVNMVSSGG